MFKLLILIGSFSSVPIPQTYQTYKYATNVKTTISEGENREDKESQPNNTFGSGDTVGRAATFEEIAKFDYLVPNWQWFTKLRSDAGIGYTDLSYEFGSKGVGLCEYISMSMLLQYQELFVSSGLFTNSEWKKWFTDGGSNYLINTPYHKYYREKNPSEGLVMNLYHTINKVDLKSSKDVFNAFNNFLWGKSINNKIQQAKSANTAHTSHPSDYIKKEGVPVMFSFVTLSISHNITIYGYNSKTKELAFHIGWSDDDVPGENSMRIVKQSSLWSFFSLGFWNTIYVPKNTNKNAPRKAFKYKGIDYSWNELQAMGKSWNDIRPI